MKKYITYFTLALTLALGACNNEFNEEAYQHVIGLKSVLNSEGTTNIYLRYEPNGKTIYSLPVIVGGSTVNGQDLDVRLAVDPDTLAVMNEERYKLREDLYYKLLGEEHYTFVSPTCHIPAGESVGLFDIEFNFTDLDLREKWVLPLTIVDDPSYTPNPRKNYRKAFLRVMPFNDYSGSYGASTMNLTIEGTDPTTVRFNEDGTLTVTPADPANEMGLSVGDCTYTTSSKEDEADPNIVHEYTTLNMTYSYNNFTDHHDQNGDPILINYSAKGYYTMERRINTLIPDRDQAIQW